MTTSSTTPWQMPSTAPVLSGSDIGEMETGTPVDRQATVRRFVDDVTEVMQELADHGTGQTVVVVVPTS